MTSAITASQVRHHARVVAAIVDDIGDAWDAWPELDKRLTEVENWLRDTPRPIPSDFAIPRYIRVRGAKTVVQATNVSPANWVVDWSWSIDGASRGHGTDNPVELDTSDLSPGDHTLSVTAHFIRPIAEVKPGQPAPAAPKHSIAQDFHFGEHIVNALHSENLYSPVDVVQRLSGPAKRFEFATTHQLAPEEVQRVARQVEMSRIVGVTPQKVLLLERAHVESPRQLATRNPSNLWTKLGTVREPDDPEVTLDEVVAWINSVDGFEFMVFNEDAD
jgi:hypothetical protein